jgi:PPOX class probable F420-dependent enzyme
MAFELLPRHLEYLQAAYFLWLTTLRADLMPLPTPVWFVVEGDTILIYTNPTTLKVKNIGPHPQIALSHHRDEVGEDFIIIIGEAHPDPAAPSVAHHAAYLEKYRTGISRIGLTIGQYAAHFSLALRIIPRQVRMYEISPDEFGPPSTAE